MGQDAFVNEYGQYSGRVKKRFVTTIAASTDKAEYALEGSVFVAVHPFDG